MSVSGSFSKGFHLFFQEQIFCDLLLSLNGKQYNTHQLVLVHSSEYFARLIHKKDPQGRKLFVVFNNSRIYSGI